MLFLSNVISTITAICSQTHFHCSHKWAQRLKCLLMANILVNYYFKYVLLWQNKFFSVPNFSKAI